MVLQVVELLPNGAKIPVTNENKLQYLDLLAQHRLANSVKDEIDSFLKGLNELVSDNLLSIFDENELEVNFSIPTIHYHMQVIFIIICRKLQQFLCYSIKTL